MSALAPAFANPVLDSQSVFRTVMDAFARPGRVLSLAKVCPAPAPLSAGAAAIALTLFDYETPVWLDRPLAASSDAVEWLRFHTGAPITSRPGEAAFALVTDMRALPPVDTFSTGTAEYPDRSTTLILQVEEFAGPSLTLTGPGIAGRQTFAAAPLPADFAAQCIANRALFPRGVDFLFVTAAAVAGLPRSTRIVEGG
jgi:alpha-D-ribose 1-methylphosphonate 5-triphosphate synthase subunit PhnH